MTQHPQNQLEWEVLITAPAHMPVPTEARVMWSRIAVPGGWVYRHYGNPPQIVFVPFHAD